MRICNVHVSDWPHIDKPQAQSLPRSPRQSEPITRRVDKYLKNHEASYQRMARVRKKVLEQQSQLHPEPHALDCILAHPERFKNPVLRALIHIAKITEELAEGITELSGLTERLTRNLISSGEKADLSLVIGSATGRIITGQLSWLGFALHKVVGAGLYAVSSIASIAALSLSKTRFGEIRQTDEIKKLNGRSLFDQSIYETSSNYLLSIKHHAIKKLASSTIYHNKLNNWARYMLRNKDSDRQKSASERRAHCNYMWNNMHQYGTTTRILMHLAYGVFQVVNKLGVSFDIHLGALLSRKVLSKTTGEILGSRLVMIFTVGAAAALSVPLAPVAIGLSSVGAMACGVAILALLAAKANVAFNHDWNGDIAPPPPRIRFSAG